MHDRTINLVGVFLSAALLAACGGNTAVSSAATSLEPQIGAPQSEVARSVLRRATSGTNLYVASYGSYSSGGSAVTVYAPDSKKLLQAITQGLDAPDALAFDGSGNLYVANAVNNTVQVYAQGGSSPTETISQGIYRPDALAFDSSGNLYVANNFPKPGHGRKVIKCDGDPGIYTVTVYAPGSTKVLRTISKGPCFPVSLAFDSSGNLYVANMFIPNGGGSDPGSITVYAPGSSKLLRTISKGINYPYAVEGGLLFDGSGNLYVDDEGNSNVVVYGPGSKKVLRTISQGVDAPEAMAFDGSGNLYVSNPGNNTVTVYAPGGSSPMLTISKGLDFPQGLAFDSSGNLYVANALAPAGHGPGTVTVYTPGSSSPMLTISNGMDLPEALSFGP